jgi:hypothetical protein
MASGIAKLMTFATTEPMTTSRGNPGEEIHFPLGECLTRIRGRKKDEKTELSINWPESSSYSFKLFGSGLKSVYPTVQIQNFIRTNIQILRGIFRFVKDGGIQWHDRKFCG